MRARQLLLLFLAIVLPLQAVAQDRGKPIVEVEFKEDETIPGQYLTLRVTVLVPTWMPEPVAFPSLDVPNLRIRLPERSTSPTSRTIDGNSWSGVSRRYLVSPMVRGTFSIPGQNLQVTYADPQTSEPVKAELAVVPVTLRGIVPKGAEGLDPFIAAKDLSLSQEISENLLDLKPGDSITRTITARTTGASPIILPMLIEVPAIGGFAAYADDPIIEEHEDRGLVSGTRSETLTLMVQGNGSGTLPALRIDWYDIDSRKVQSTTLDAVEISATGAPTAGADRISERDLTTIAGLAAAVVVLVVATLLAKPYVQKWLRERRVRRVASKDFAARALLAFIHKRDLAATMSALDTWAGRNPITPRSDLKEIEAALLPLTAARYGRENSAERGEDWKALAQVVKKFQRRQPRASPETPLPMLNP